MPDVAGAKIDAIKTVKASVSLARFGAECKTVQAPRSARSIRTEKTSASLARFGAGAKIGAIRTEKASASLARFGAECKTAQAPRSARSGRMRRRPPSRASAPSAIRRRRQYRRDQTCRGLRFALEMQDSTTVSTMARVIFDDLLCNKLGLAISWVVRRVVVRCVRDESKRDRCAGSSHDDGALHIGWVRKL
ncbi:hypothetical protein PR003_g32999 [Phytophthora rubi]|uniref:Uncharacterized protein n=1 Tax=Phytophthora rubi TaxID=129364 RepID=A0A6A4AWC1_9STRA|nr:hypothetical protein PR003_g32999 [Phytophthora rubi]